MEQVLLVVHVLIAAALIGVILLQRSESDGFGLGSGSGANFLSGRGAASLLTRTTAILAAAFMANALLLAVLAANNKPASIVDAIEAEQGDVAPVAEKAADAAGKEEKKMVPQVPAADVPAAKKTEPKAVKPTVDETQEPATDSNE